MAHVYNARCLVPLKNSGIKVALLNAQNRSQTLVKGTKLGEVQIVEVVPEKVVDQEMQSEELSEPERDALEKIMEKLPSDLSKVQKQKVWNLLLKYRTIISVGDHDIGRTDLVEHHIDTGNSRPIRQPLRRHPFQYLEWIDQEVAEMQKHGIVEPAASPWPSNIVLLSLIHISEPTRPY